MIRETPLSPNEGYHIYNRGVDKRVIFLDDSDHERFVALLYLSNRKDKVHTSNFLNGLPNYQGVSLLARILLDNDIEKEDSERLVDIGAYCLMPNHFHLILREHVPGGITLFMRKLMTGYSMYFNKKYERTGSLFEGTFKSKHIDSEAYLNWLFSYIHLNPVKLVDPLWKQKGISNTENVKRFMDSYKYSSYHDYFISDRAESVIISKDKFPEYFTRLNDLSVLIENWNEDKQRMVVV